ncbi:MAG TPA: hypothetical protein VHG08_14550 [Longimicrobium sp.]|nr:hypothetical protein [Longimicrobium sp.]
MSYLDLPRFHLFGTFCATPSTINNVIQNYNPDTPFIDSMGPEPGARGWNPSGRALFKVDVTVQTVTGADGKPVASGDALIGATLVSIPNPNHAKIVDLDPHQQNVSQVFGLTVQLIAADGTALFTGSVAPCALAELWTRTAGQRPSITTAAAMYQTIIQVTRWGAIKGSKVLRALQKQAGNTLSIRWNLDGFNGNPQDPGFGLGRMTATVGPAYAGEPLHFLAARRLATPPGAPPPTRHLWFAPFRVDSGRSTLVLDLGNSVATTTPGGPFTLRTLPVSVNVYGDAAEVGRVEYTLESYQVSAGVFELPIPNSQLHAVETQPLGITVDAGDLTTYPLLEAQDGTLIGADLSFLRLNPGERATVTFYATRFGRRYARCPVDLSLCPQGGNLGNDPPGGLSWTPATPKTGRDGTVTVTFKGGSTAPKAAWRAQNDIDGQVYFVSGSWFPTILSNDGVVPVSALVFDKYKPRSNPPTWWGDIQPIMYQYARLYPGMRQILDIADYGTLQQVIHDGKTGAQLVLEAMQLPIEHPHHMPVTRDLSAAKLKAYAAWVKAGCPEGTRPLTAAGVPAEEVAVAAGPRHGPGSDSIKSTL